LAVNFYSMHQDNLHRYLFMMDYIIIDTWDMKHFNSQKG
jgi:hypothetical protein